MSSRCSICRHPQRDSIDVSVLQNGTRATARHFQLSRSSLNRHKRHLPQAVAAAGQSPESAAGSNGAPPLLTRIEAVIRCCENALSQVQAKGDLPGVVRTMSKLLPYYELKYKLESEERKHRGLLEDRPEPMSRASHGPQLSPKEICENLKVVTLRLRIKLAQRSLGEQAMISEPTNLEYLREQEAALAARLEQRELLRQSKPLERLTKPHFSSDP